MALRLALLSSLCVAAALAAADGDVPFYFSNVTGASQWTRPPAMPYFSEEGRAYWVHDGVPSWTAADPADRWASHWDDSGSQFFEHENGTVSWDRPVVYSWSVRSSLDHFWYNTQTRATQRERPAVLGHHSEEHNATFYVEHGVATWEAPPDSSWVEVSDPATQRVYYHNTKTSDVAWEAPPDSNVAWVKWFGEIDDKELLR
jgi:hypothetical protein